MSDIKLFQISGNVVTTITGQPMAIERSLQTLLERHLESFLGVSFLASEYTTGKSHGGRIDTLGIDENGCPVIIEYKRSLNENVINQGLYYLDWLMDHKAEFVLLVQKRCSNRDADYVNWSGARLLCIAGEFTKYDEHAVKQINRNIELIRYRRYGENLLLLELVNATTVTSADMFVNIPNGRTTPAEIVEVPASGTKPRSPEATVEEKLAKSSAEVKDRIDNLKTYLLALGDDVQFQTLRYYFAFKRIKNFACVEVHPQNGKIIVFVKADMDHIQLEPGFTRDVRKIGNYGTGDLEITISSDADLERAKPLIEQSYENN